MLGDFSKERPEVEESFGWFGTTVRVNPNISDLAIIQMFKAISSAPAEEALGVTRQIAETLVHSGDVDRFLASAVENRQTIEDLIDLANKLIEALTARPTVRPSDSSAGPSSTEARSTGDASSQALRRLEGRPDLQVAVLRAQAAS